MSPFDTLAAALAAPYRQSQLADSEPVELRRDGQNVGRAAAILYEQRQEQPEFSPVAGQIVERWSEVVRDVEFLPSELAALGVRPAIGMAVVIDGQPWPVRRVVSDTATCLRVECVQKVKREGFRPRQGGAR